MVRAARDLSGKTIDGRYAVDYELGRGGMGVVWAARHTESRQRVALKTLDAELARDPRVRERLLREARAAASLRSRHVVRILDAQLGYEEDGEPLPYLVMEHLEGLTLGEWLTSRGALSPGELFWVAEQLGRALGAAHELGIVHRDVKPSNVFLTRDEDAAPLVKLCDFGVAKLGDGAAAELLESAGIGTGSGDVLGTPLYLAPELLRGAAGATAASDQWSLALTVFRALSGREYWGDVRTGPELVLRIAQDPLPRPSELAPELGRELDAWFARSCARQPGERFPNVLDQVQALGVALGQPKPLPLAVPADAFPGAVARDPGQGLARVLTATERKTFVRQAALTLAMAWAVGGVFWIWLALPGARNGAPPPAAVSAAARPTAGPAPPAPRVPLENPVPGASSSAFGAREPAAGAVASPSVASAPRVARNRPALSAAVSAPRTGVMGAEAPRASGQTCVRSAECQSGLCVAERCR